mgnify:CR=1 FL=1
MKKIFSLICMATLALSFVACSDDDEVGAQYNRASTISVVKSDVLFSASAGTGTVVVKADGPISFSTASDWCKANALNDSTIEVSVENNEQNEGRASLLTIKSGIDSVNVTVQQQGFYLQSDMGTAVAFGDKASVESFAFNTSGAPVVSSTAEWLSASIEGDSLVISTSANESGHLRQGYVKYAFGEFKDSVLVSQYDFDADIAGTYYLAYTNRSTGKTNAVYAQLGADENGSLALDLPQLGFTVPVDFNKASCQLAVHSGAYVGDYPYDESTTYIVGTVLGSSAAGYITYSSSVTFSAQFQYDEEDGTYAMFEDDGSWTRPVDYLAFYAFTSKEFTSKTRVGSLMVMLNPYLLKLDESENAKKLHFSAPAMNVLKK